MYRRQVLATCAGTALLAGCTEGDGTTAGTPAETSPAETTADDASESHLEAARAELEAAWETFDEERAKYDDPDDRVSFRRELIDEHLDRTRDHLDEAEQTGETEQSVIDALRDVVAWSRDMVSTFERFGAATDEYGRATTLLDNERFDDAADGFEMTVDRLDEADEQLSTARDRFEDLDRDAVDDYDEVAALELELEMDDMADQIADFRTLTQGVRHVALGYRSYRAGDTEFQAENFGTAEEEFANARAEFESAHEIISGGEADASPEFEDHFIGLSCLTDALADSADHLGMAADAASKNRVSAAEDEAEAAGDVLERCEYDL